MKKKEIKRIRKAIDEMRCPECNSYKLEILSLEPPSALCGGCGWYGRDLV